jgi:hypothetical protein
MLVSDISALHLPATAMIITWSIVLGFRTKQREDFSTGIWSNGFESLFCWSNDEHCNNLLIWCLQFYASARLLQSLISANLP